MPQRNEMKCENRVFFFHFPSSTAISLGDSANQPKSTKEQIFENIRLHKEVLQSVKAQPWSMKRKLRLVRQVRIFFSRSNEKAKKLNLWFLGSRIYCSSWRCITRTIRNVTKHQRSVGSIQNRFGRCKFDENIWKQCRSNRNFIRLFLWLNLPFRNGNMFIEN